MRKVKFVFLILHYMAEKMTLQCIESIEKKCKNYDYQIIVVDNGSTNDSGKSISNKLKDDIKCKVILSEINLGFAQGNNLGWNYIRNNVNAEFVIVMNNDVLLVDDNFCETIDSLYTREHFALLGPDIYASRCNIHQNPSSLSAMSRNELINLKKHFERKEEKFLIYYIKEIILQRMSHPVKKALKKLRPKWFVDPAYYKAKEILDPVLHGACIIYSNDFLRNEEYAFCPDTFMYMEEYILHYYSLMKQYKIIYSSELVVHHLEDVSTDAMYKSNYKKERMKTVEMAKSLGVLLRMMENE